MHGDLCHRRMSSNNGTRACRSDFIRRKLGYAAYISYHHHNTTFMSPERITLLRLHHPEVSTLVSVGSWMSGQ